MSDWADKASGELGLAVISLPHLFVGIPHSDTEISILQHSMEVRTCTKHLIVELGQIQRGPTY